MHMLLSAAHAYADPICLATSQDAFPTTQSRTKGGLSRRYTLFKTVWSDIGRMKCKPAFLRDECVAALAEILICDGALISEYGEERPQVYWKFRLTTTSARTIYAIIIHIGAIVQAE